MPPCVICEKPLKKGEGKIFPMVDNLRNVWCDALGLLPNTFNNIETRRNVCWEHFDDTSFYYDANGRKILRPHALPKRLSDEEIRNFPRYYYSRIRRPPSRSDNELSSPASSSVQNPRVFSYPMTTSPRPLVNVSYLASPNVPNQPAVSSLPDHLADICQDFEDDLDYQIENLPDYRSVRPNPKYLLVETNQLLKLFKTCPECGHSPEKANAVFDTFIGTACKIKMWCNNCNEYVEWHSQSKLNNTGKYRGNVEIPNAAAIVPIQYSSLKELADIIDLPFISESTFRRNSKYVWPEVHHEHDEIQKKLISELIEKQQNGHAVRLAGDTQFDSRGYSAEFGSSGLMDAERKTMLHTEAVHKSETNGNSGLMENEGLVRGLQFLESNGVQIHSLTTDRHKQVIKTMSTRFSHILHYYDPWHVIKGVASMLRQECKNVRGKPVQVWSQALLNHLWYCVKAADGDGKLCQEYVLAALLHVIGVHTWGPGKVVEIFTNSHLQVMANPSPKYEKNKPEHLPGMVIHQLEFERHLGCNHIVDSTKPTLKPDTATYGVLQKYFTSDSFLNDISKLSPSWATSRLEGYHGLVVNKYRPKHLYYKKHGFVSRTKLAVLHHNYAIFAEEEGDRYYTKVTKKLAKHRGGEMIKTYEKPAANYSWKIKLVQKALLAASRADFNDEDFIDVEERSTDEEEETPLNDIFNMSSQSEESEDDDLE